MRHYHLPRNLPPAIPSEESTPPPSCWFELRDKQARELFDRRVVEHFRRSKNITLRGQVKLDV